MRRDYPTTSAAKMAPADPSLEVALGRNVETQPDWKEGQWARIYKGGA
jgi:hypothetical protein